MVTHTIRYILHDARHVGDGLRPLHLRVEHHADGTVRVALGVESGTRINWAMVLTPEAAQAVAEKAHFSIDAPPVAD